MPQLRHSAFLNVRDGKLHFGCENPFCCHGNPGLPYHWSLPLESGGFKMEFVSHEPHKALRLRVTLLLAGGGLPAGTSRDLECVDELAACEAAFTALWPEIEELQKRQPVAPRFV
jgi:hypothetical protein